MEDSQLDGLNIAKNMNEYEQRRIFNLKRNYEVYKPEGSATHRVRGSKKRNNTKIRRRKEKESMFKNVTLKLFGVDKNFKLSKENFPPDSKLRKFIGQVQISRKKEKLKKKLDVSFLKDLLKDAENLVDKFGVLLPRKKSKDLDVLNETGLDVENNTRYPRRNVKRKIYKEEDCSSEDEFLHCDACHLQYKGVCPRHGPMIWVCDRKTNKNDPDRAVSTMPEFLSLSTSSIPKADLGVWTEIPLPQGFVFGPYKGRIIRNRRKAQKSGYAWQVRKGPKAHHFVEAQDRSASNWLRFVNCASREEQQNVVAFQYQKAIYYRTYKPILPHTEILVWYGDNYASDMGIETKVDNEAVPPPSKAIEGFKCDVCKTLFTSSSALEGHRKRHPKSGRRHRCPHCRYSSDKKCHLREHLLTHTGERKHRCDRCHKAFAVKTNLRDHLRTHTGERPFVCTTCGKGFKRSTHLVRHSRAHSGERPFRCATCGKDFFQAVHLQWHERTHTQQKPYRCPHCPHRSTQWPHHLQHVITKHTRDFTHKCSICSKGFDRPSRLKEHIKKHHPMETSKENTTQH